MVKEDSIILHGKEALFRFGHQVRKEEGGFSMMLKPRMVEDGGGGCSGRVRRRVDDWIVWEQKGFINVKYILCVRDLDNVRITTGEGDIEDVGSFGGGGGVGW